MTAGQGTRFWWTQRLASCAALLGLVVQLTNPAVGLAAPQPSATPSQTPSTTPRPAETSIATLTATTTSVPSATAVAFDALTATPTLQPSPTMTDTATETPTLVASPTASPTVTMTATGSVTAIASIPGVTVGVDGGEVDLAPDVHVSVPANAVAEPLTLSMGPPDGPFIARNAILRVFSLKAHSTRTGRPIIHFAHPLTVRVGYDPTGLDQQHEQNLELDYWDTVWGGWRKVPGMVDLTAHTITAQTDHFTDYSVLNEGSAQNVYWPQSADVNNFTTDLYGGAAAFRYPFELPPGTGGLSPKLNLIGSSTAAYAARRAHLADGIVAGGKPSQEAGWVGLGFQLDIPYVEMHKVTLANDQTVSRYVLFFGGSSYKLIPDPNNPGEYRTESEQFLKIHSYGDHWELHTRDGTRYLFGIQVDPGVRPPGVTPKFPVGPTLQYVDWPSPTTPQLLPFTWYLSEIEDTSGNVVVIGYDHFSDNNKYAALAGPGAGCNSNGLQYDQSVYPVVMTYSYVNQYGAGPTPVSGSVPQVRVYFNRTSWQRQDFLQATDIRNDTCIQVYYSDRALDSIDVKVLENGAETPVRHYQFSYSNGIPLFLTGIQEQAGGQSLPAVTLYWSLHTDTSTDDQLGNPPIPVFDSIENGYNGRVSYAYSIVEPGGSYKDSWGSGKTQIPITLPQVTQRTADPGASGESPSIVDTYSYAGAAGNSDPIEPEFRGYSSVVQNEGNKSVEHDFLQGTGGTMTFFDGTSFTDADQLKGQEWRTVTRQGSVVLQAVEKAFSMLAGSGTPSGSAFVALTTQETEAYPAGSTNTNDSGRKIGKSTYQYDSYGNVSQEQDEDPSNTSALCRVVNRGYTYNTGAWIVDKPFYENVLDCSNNLLTNTGYYYDANYNTPTPPSEVSPPTPSAGHLTMLRRMVRYDAADASGPCLHCTRTYYTYDQYGNRTSVTDPNGNTTSTSYDSTGTYPQTVTYPKIGSASATWDVGLSKPKTTTDVNQQTTSYAYDPFGRLVGVAKPGDSLAAPTVGYLYHDNPSSWTPVSNYGTDAAATPYVRGGWNDASSKYLLTDDTNQLRFDTNGTYDYHDMIGRQYSAPAGSKIVRVSFDYSANYDNAWFNLAMDTSSGQNVWSDNLYGTTNGSVDLRWSQDQAPAWVAFGLYQVGGPGSRISVAGWFGQITNLTLYYTTDHYVTTTQRIDASTSRVQTDFYDGLGRVFETKVPDENGKFTTTFQTYDANGRLQEKSVPIESSTNGVEQPNWPALVKATDSYDALDRPTSVQDPSSGTTTTAYSGWTSTVADANGHSKSFTRDAGGRMAEVDASATTDYSYDAADRLVQVFVWNNPANVVTSIQYDGLGRKTHISDPDMGTWSYGYDATGNLMSQIDARGQVSLYQYDALNRLTAVGTPGPTPISASGLTAVRSQIDQVRQNNGLSAYAWANPATITTSSVVGAATFNELRTALMQVPGYGSMPDFTAGSISQGRPVRLADLADLQQWVNGSFQPANWSGTISYGYDQGTNGNGRRTGMTDEVGSTADTYDMRGRLQTETRTQSGNTYVTRYAYNDADQVTTLTYPDASAEAVTTDYNVRGLPLSMTGAGGTYVSGTSYDALGRPLTLTYGNSSQSIFTHDAPTTRLSAFSAPNVSRSYGYDAVGNLTCLDPGGAKPCNASNAGVEAMSYDAWNRVTGVSVNGAGLDSYSYDPLGDILTKSEGSTSISLAYGAANPVHAPVSVSGAGYAYDKAGNLLSRGSTSYVYDWQNHLVQVNQPSGSTQFRYDGDGKLAQRIDANGTVDYIGDLYEKNVTTGVETKRYSLGGTLVATKVGGTLSYLHADYLRSTVSASNGASVEYTPYGLVRSSSGTLPTDRQFQGQQNQASVGLYHMGARWYDPTIGIWTQPDTGVPNPLDPNTLNRYGFALGNPLTFVDPSGHAVQLPAEYQTSTTVIDVAPPLEVNQAQITIGSQSLPTTLITTVGPALEPCCVDTAPPALGRTAVQVAPPGDSPSVYAAMGKKTEDDQDPADFETLLKQDTSEPDPQKDPSSPVGSRFREAGINPGDHFLERLQQRGDESGINEGDALDVYFHGDLYYDRRYDNWVRFDRRLGLAVVIDRNGTPVSVFDEDHPRGDWNPVNSIGDVGSALP